MNAIQDLPLFVVAAVLLNIAPGPDSLLVVTRSAAQGWRAGSAATLGICAGTFVHILAAALGLSAVLAASSVAFAVVKYVGAAYLLYVGVTMLFTKHGSGSAATAESRSPGQSYSRILLQGFLTNVLNPKVALFFVAFVPQFIDAQSANAPAGFLLLGIIFNTTNAIWCHILALVTAFTRNKVRTSERVATWLNRAIGAMFVSFGVRLALTQRN